MERPTKASLQKSLLSLMNSPATKITILDTTMRDGELVPHVQMNLAQKLELANLLELMGVDVLEVGYPGMFEKDFAQVLAIAQSITNSVICGLAGSKPEEIASVAAAIKPANRGRIHVYNQVNLRHQSLLDEQQTLDLIKTTVSLARNECAEVEWSAFDAARSDRDFLCKAIEAAIHSGATIINIPDTMGTCSVKEFTELIDFVFNQVPNIDQSIVSVHCHNDQGLSVENSIASLSHGVRQIECSINGLGARKGNANLGEILQAIEKQSNFYTDIDPALLNQASQLVTQITGV